jgi:hypothetical protein
MQCPRCQHENPQQAKLCLECGEPVGPQIQARSPQSYTPKHVADS